MNRSKRTALLNKVRKSLVLEGLRDGMTLGRAEAYATHELSVFRKPTFGKRKANNRILRLVAGEC